MWPIDNEQNGVHKFEVRIGEVILEVKSLFKCYTMIAVLEELLQL